MEYITIDDLHNHSSLNDVYFKHISLTRNLKQHHNIEGWCNITGVLGDGRIIPMFDVWCGFRFKHEDRIRTIIFYFCQQIGVQFK